VSINLPYFHNTAETNQHQRKNCHLEKEKKKKNLREKLDQTNPQTSFPTTAFNAHNTNTPFLLSKLTSISISQFNSGVPMVVILRVLATISDDNKVVLELSSTPRSCPTNSVQQSHSVYNDVVNKQTFTHSCNPSWGNESYNGIVANSSTLHSKYQKATQVALSHTNDKGSDNILNKGVGQSCQSIPNHQTYSHIKHLKIHAQIHAH
jgi:hypothetical protein